MNETLFNLLIILVFLVVFPLFWSVVVLLISALGGWGALARLYPAYIVATEPLGRWEWQHLRMRLANYNAIVIISAYDEGLMLDVFWMFRPGHPPLLIPWEEMSLAPQQLLWNKYVRVRVERAPHLWVDLPQHTADKLATAVGKPWTQRYNQEP